MYPILLRLGSFELRSYSVIVALATLAGYLLARREASRRGLGDGLLEDFAPAAIWAGIVGARLYYVAFFDPQMFLRRPLEVLAIWRGGLAVHGALLAGLLAAVWYCRRRGIRFWELADTLAPALIFGQAIGRLACFLNGDAYGIATDVPWAVTFTDPAALAPLGVPLHPTQLYELGLNFVLFGIIWSVRRRPLRPGEIFLMYVGGYGAIRFFVESFRADQLQFANGVSVAQTVSVVALIASLGAVAMLHRPQRRPAA